MADVIDIKCTQCNKLNSRRYGWIDPSKFKDPTQAFLISSFYCAFCSKGNAVKIRFLTDQKMTFEEGLDFKSLIREDALPFFIGDSNDNDEIKSLEILSENDALSLLNDIDD
jgi:hypothetical protein